MMISFRPTHREFRFLACGLFVAGVAALLFVDPSFAQDATAPPRRRLPVTPRP